MAAIFGEQEYLSWEVGDHQQVLVARSQLREAIDELWRASEERVKRLDEKTFYLKAICEAQESRIMAEKSHSMALSMKRLSWVAVIPLPATKRLTQILTMYHSSYSCL